MILDENAYGCFAHFCQSLGNNMPATPGSHANSLIKLNTERSQTESISTAAKPFHVHVFFGAVVVGPWFTQKDEKDVARPCLDSETLLAGPPASTTSSNSGLTCLTILGAL